MNLHQGESDDSWMFWLIKSGRCWRLTEHTDGITKTVAELFLTKAILMSQCLVIQVQVIQLIRSECLIDSLSTGAASGLIVT